MAGKKFGGELHVNLTVWWSTFAAAKLKYFILAYIRMVIPLEKTFTGGSKAMKFVNVFSLESFPLYGMWY